jgi:calcineurin-like phosphoesterase
MHPFIEDPFQYTHPPTRPRHLATIALDVDMHGETTVEKKREPK